MSHVTIKRHVIYVIKRDVVFPKALLSIHTHGFINVTKTLFFLSNKRNLLIIKEYARCFGRVISQKKKKKTVGRK